jgi:hypothetical protein
MYVIMGRIHVSKSESFFRKIIITFFYVSIVFIVIISNTVTIATICSLQCNELISWSPFEKLTVAQPLKKFPALS